MDMNLKVFTAIAEQKSFTKAAQLLHLTPPAVSLRIKTLEEKMGIQLFIRSNKHVQLTKAGEILYENGKQILMQYANIHHLIEELKSSPSGPLAIGAAYTFGEYFLPNILHAFSKVYPNVEPSVVIQNSKTIMNLIEKHELDVGIIVENEVQSNSKFDVSLYSEDEMVLVVPKNHLILYQNKLDLNLLENEKWILREKGSGTRHVTELLFSQLNIKPKKIMSFGSSQTIKESVELGMGISYLSEFIVRKEVSLGLLKTIKLKKFPNKGQFHIIKTKDKLPTKTTELFLNFLNTYESYKNNNDHISLILS